MSDYGDACATIRTIVRSALAKTSRITGMTAGPASEAIVEQILAEMHDRSISWALREIIDRPE